MIKVKKVLLVPSLLVCLTSLAHATLQIDWVSSGFYLGEPTPLLDPTGVLRPSSTLAQLIWTPDAMISSADPLTVDYLSGNEVLLRSYTVNSSDRPSGEFAYWGSGEASFADSGAGLPPSYQTGYIYARIFQTSTPSANDIYYASPIVAALGYYWDGSGATPLPNVFNMNDGSTNLSAPPYDVALSSFQVVPEPGTIGLLAMGVMTLGGAAYKRRKAGVVEA
jgi:hypothetical protein